MGGRECIALFLLLLLQLLKGAVDAETLTYDDYLARVGTAIQADMALLRALKERGFQEAFTVTMMRLRKMKAELDAANS